MKKNDLMAQFEAHLEMQEMHDYAMDFFDDFEQDELTQLVREKILTIDEVEAGLRRKHGLTRKAG